MCAGVVFSPIAELIMVHTNITISEVIQIFLRRIMLQRIDNINGPNTMTASVKNASFKSGSGGFSTIVDANKNSLYPISKYPINAKMAVVSSAATILKPALLVTPVAALEADEDEPEDEPE